MEGDNILANFRVNSKSLPKNPRPEKLCSAGMDWTGAPSTNMEVGDMTSYQVEIFRQAKKKKNTHTINTA